MRAALGTRVQGIITATSAATATLWASTASAYNYLSRMTLTWTNVSAPGAGGSLIQFYEGDVTNSNSVWAFSPNTTNGFALVNLGDEGFRASSAGSHFGVTLNSVGTLTGIFTGYQATYA
jgi:hypothetical protein